MTERNLKQTLQEAYDRIFYRYADINGNIHLPNSYEGDIMRLVLKAYEKSGE